MCKKHTHNADLRAKVVGAEFSHTHTNTPNILL